jgi:glutamate transport system permease protein
MFDPPGPRGRRRARIGTAVTVLVVLGLLFVAVRRFDAAGQLEIAKWRPFLTWPVWRYLLTGLWATALAAVVVFLLASAAGLGLAFGRMSSFPWPFRGYIEVMRTIPVLLLIYVMLFVLPSYGLDLPLFWKLVVPLALSHAAQFAEIFRAGVLAVDRGQREAGASLGLSHAQNMRLIVLPQAVRHVLPSLVSQSVGLLKDTALGYVVSYLELLQSARVLANFNHLLIQSFLVVALIYLVVNASLSKLARHLEARSARSAR